MAVILRTVRGVISATVRSDGSEAIVLRKAVSGADTALVTAVQDAGYGAAIIPTSTATLAVRGLACEDCESKADAVVRKLAGTRRVVVSKRTKRATVTYETRKTSVTRIVTALTKAGFPARRIR